MTKVTKVTDDNVAGILDVQTAAIEGTQGVVWSARLKKGQLLPLFYANSPPNCYARIRDFLVKHREGDA